MEGDLSYQSEDAQVKEKKKKSTLNDLISSQSFSLSWSGLWVEGRVPLHHELDTSPSEGTTHTFTLNITIAIHLLTCFWEVVGNPHREHAQKLYTTITQAPDWTQEYDAATLPTAPTCHPMTCILHRRVLFLNWTWLCRYVGRILPLVMTSFLHYPQFHSTTCL